jgi:hypothetical protein
MITRRSFHTVALMLLANFQSCLGTTPISLSPNKNSNIAKENIPESMFNLDISIRLANLVQQAYSQFEEYKKPPSWEIDKNYKLIQPIFDGNIPFGFVATDLDRKNVYISIRGTLTFLEWFKDAQIELISYQNGKAGKSSKIIPVNGDYGSITKGFRDIYVNLRDDIINGLKECPKDANVYITGHSLGSALATLAIPDILNNTHFTDPQKIVMYTFASPRCGNRDFAQAMSKTGVQHWRIANTEDIVPSLPFPTGNIFKPGNENQPPEPIVQSGAEQGNLMFKFLKDYYDAKKKRMPEYAHTGTPAYFTTHDGALERNHNMDETYVKGLVFIAKMRTS